MTSAATMRAPTTVVSLRPCPICRDDRARALHRQRYALFDDSDLPAETSIDACGACDMVYAASDAGAVEYRDHYARHAKYNTAVMVSGSGESPADAQRLDALARFVAANVAPLATHDARRTLDIGAGRGGLLIALRRHGYERSTGLDPSAGCVAAMRVAGFSAEVGTLEQDAWPTDPERFDLIVLSHVLEHVYDVADAFDRVTRRATPGGAIYLEVPDAARYTVDGFPPFYFFDPEHINHFDGPMLGALAERHGWTVVATWERELALDAGQRYPAIGVLLQRADDRTRVSTVAIPRSTTAFAIARYVADSRRAVEGSTDATTLARLAEGATPIVLWGAGSHAQRLLAQTALADCSIACLIDSDPGKQGRHLGGYRVVSPEVGLALAAARAATIVVAIAVGAEQVVALIRQERPGLVVVRI